MATLTKSDVKFDELRLSRQTTINPETGLEETKWYIDVGYQVLTVEGEEYNRDKQIELTGTRKTTAINFLTDLYNLIKNQESI